MTAHAAHWKQSSVFLLTTPVSGSFEMIPRMQAVTQTGSVQCWQYAARSTSAGPSPARLIRILASDGRTAPVFAREHSVWQAPQPSHLD
jgi:hypothetical protein